MSGSSWCEGERMKVYEIACNRFVTPADEVQ
jgi:hypothetical protein